MILRHRIRLLDLRPGEGRLAALMALHYYLLLLFYYLLKPARDSLFLVEVEPSQLPLAYMATALVAAPVTAAYARAGMRRRLDRLLSMTTGFLCLSLAALWWLARLPHHWVYFLLYVWVGVAGGLTTSQFWLLANGIYDAGEAKRIFPILSIGGIAGAFTGGEVTSFLIDAWNLETRDLLLVSVGVMAAAGLAAHAAWRQGGGILEPTAGLGGGDAVGSGKGGIIRAILRSRHLTLTVGIIALTVMTASFVDYIFKSVSVQAFTSGEELTAFLGRFYGRMSLLSLAVQILLATRLLRWFGAAGMVLILPAVLAGGAIAMAVLPGLGAAMFLRGSDITLKYSLDKTSRELLFLPIPLPLKKRTKVFMDMFVDRWARGLAGGLLLLLTTVLGFGLRSVAWVTLGLIAAWFTVGLFIRREYLNSFREAVSRRQIDLGSLRVRLDDPGTLGVLIGALGSPNHREVLYAQEMLDGAVSPRLAPALRPLLAHPKAEVRRRALDLLAPNAVGEDAALVEPLMRDESLEVREGAVRFLARAAESGGGREVFTARVAGMLGGEPLCRNAALAFIDRAPGGRTYDPMITRALVEAVLGDRTPWGGEGRRVLGGFSWRPAACGDRVFDVLLADDDPKVVEATIRGCGRRHDLARTPWLLEQLGHPQWRTHARSALAELARNHPALIVRMEEYFLDPGVPARSRAEIPRALAAAPVQAGVDLLLKHLATHRPELRYEVLKALGKLRARYQGLSFDGKAVSREVAIEAARYLQLARLTLLLPGEGEKAALLARAIGETQQLRLESVFRLLGLLYPAKDLLNAYHGLMSGRRILRANAQEFLDNLLTGSHRQLVRSLLDEQPVTEAWLAAGVAGDVDPGLEIRTEVEALDFIGASCDPWLAACAIAAGGTPDNPAARCYLIPLGDEMLSTVEKVLLLQNVELFARIPTDQLAALGAIAREVPVLAGDTIYREHDHPDALYMVLQGAVQLHQGLRTISVAGPRETFGIWALFDPEPRVMSATAMEDSRLLRIDRNEFNDLLADDVRIAQGIIRTVAGRLRSLAERLS